MWKLSQYFEFIEHVLEPGPVVTILHIINSFNPPATLLGRRYSPTLQVSQLRYSS